MHGFPLCEIMISGPAALILNDTILLVHFHQICFDMFMNSTDNELTMNVTDNTSTGDCKEYDNVSFP
jgi:hypothetical protein